MDVRTTLLPPQLTHLNLFFLMIGRMMRTDLATFLTSTRVNRKIHVFKRTTSTVTSSSVPSTAVFFFFMLTLYSVMWALYERAAADGAPDRAWTSTTG